MEQIKKIKLFLFDMDGTLYLGDRLFPFTKELLNFIRKSGRDYLFTTNNSSKTPDEYENKLKKIGFWEEGDLVYTSAMATAEYLQEFYPSISSHRKDLPSYPGSRRMHADRHLGHGDRIFLR